MVHRSPVVSAMVVSSILDVSSKFWGSKKSQMRVYYCEMHGCKFNPLVCSIFGRSRCCSYNRAPVYIGSVREVVWLYESANRREGIIFYLYFGLMICNTMSTALVSKYMLPNTYICGLMSLNSSQIWKQQLQFILRYPCTCAWCGRWICDRFFAWIFRCNYYVMRATKNSKDYDLRNSGNNGGSSTVSSAQNATAAAGTAGSTLMTIPIQVGNTMVDA